MRDGQYHLGGVAYQLPISEPARNNAIHGLTRSVGWSLLDHRSDAVAQRIRLFPQPGWPGLLEAAVTHQLTADGLQVRVEATNLSGMDLPFGYAAHPYLTVGEDVVDDVELTVPAHSVLEVDERLLPRQVLPVEGTTMDLRRPSLLGPRSLDAAMTDLQRDASGRWTARLRRGDRETALWGDAAMRWVQVFTGGPYRNWSIAVEPMTCGPDAFNDGPTHDDLVMLRPEESISVTWGISGK